MHISGRTIRIRCLARHANGRACPPVNDPELQWGLDHTGLPPANRPVGSDTKGTPGTAALQGASESTKPPPPPKPPATGATQHRESSRVVKPPLSQNTLSVWWCPGTLSHSHTPDRPDCGDPSSTCSHFYPPRYSITFETRPRSPPEAALDPVRTPCPPSALAPSIPAGRSSLSFGARPRYF